LLVVTSEPRLWVELADGLDEVRPLAAEEAAGGRANVRRALLEDADARHRLFGEWLDERAKLRQQLGDVGGERSQLFVDLVDALAVVARVPQPAHGGRDLSEPVGDELEVLLDRVAALERDRLRRRRGLGIDRYRVAVRGRLAAHLAGRRAFVITPVRAWPRILAVVGHETDASTAPQNSAFHHRPGLRLRELALARPHGYPTQDDILGRGRARADLNRASPASCHWSRSPTRPAAPSARGRRDVVLGRDLREHDQP
jgi:hypothetical protein